MKSLKWAPAVLLISGTLLSKGVRPQMSAELLQPLSTAVPVSIGADRATDRKMSDAERAVVAPTDYVFRTYGDRVERNTASYKYSVYVGYHARQTRGQTIHSPRNCLPGSGWEALENSTAVIDTNRGNVTVNKYLVHRKGQSALVVYWYQGRGRIESNEYRVKWNLLRDAALRRRSEEALVRVMVPVQGSEEEAFKVAATVAAQLVGAVNKALPS